MSSSPNRSPGVRAAVNPMEMMEELAARAADTELPIGEIEVVPDFNPRRLISDDAFSEAALADLAQSIREKGVLQPVLVRRKGSKTLLIAGERRLRAARLAGLRRIPVVVLEADDQQAYEIAIIENAQRQGLDVVTETLVGFDYLARKMQMAVPEVVTYLNAVRKGRRADDHQAEQLLRAVYGTGVVAWSIRRAAILKMSPKEHECIRKGGIDAKVCAELVVLPPGEVRTSLLERAVLDRLSSEQLRVLVRAELQPKGDQDANLSARVVTLKKSLPKLARLKGEKATRARKLIAEIEQKVDALLRD